METLEQVLEEENKLLKKIIKDQELKILEMARLNSETFNERMKLEEKINIYQKERENKK